MKNKYKTKKRKREREGKIVANSNKQTYYI